MTSRQACQKFFAKNTRVGRRNLTSRVKYRGNQYKEFSKLVANPATPSILRPMLLEHLLDPEFTDVCLTPVDDLLAAQASTVSLNAYSDVLTELHADHARLAFEKVTNPTYTADEQRAAVVSLRVPQAVRHLAGMLSQYDWDFVEQAKQLRGYVVAGILEETKSSDARIRLAALKLLGTVTEIAAFTERTEIIHKDASETELTERIRARLQKMLPPQQAPTDVVDMTPGRDIFELASTQPVTLIP